MRRSAVTRRSFLGGLIALGAVACSSGGSSGSDSGSTTTAPSLPVPDLGGDPFLLGVASGDPRPDGVVLWTRLALDDHGTMPRVDVPVGWELATDDGFAEVVARGTAVATPALGHSVHVDVTELEPEREYWYRFAVGGTGSEVGRTRTPPPEDAELTRLRFATASCQAYQSGFYTAYEHLAAEDDLAFVLFLGDYIYELEASVAARVHDAANPRSLREYRTLYAITHADGHLRAAHAAAPWISIWDDHEVEDNYAALEPGGIGSTAPDAEARFPARRAAAYQAWWENMPVRGGPPEDGALRIYRDFAFGDLVRLAVVDDRQHRTPLPTGEGAGNLPRGAGGGPQLEGAFDPDATLLGEEQEAWLEDVLGGSTQAWNVLGQQTVMAEVDRAPDDPARGFSMDTWDGYVAARNRLLGFVDREPVRNFVSIGGDIHTSAVTDLHADYHEDGSPLVGAELVAPSTTSLELLPEGYAAATLENPHIHLYDTQQRGYLACTVTPHELRADFRYVATTLEPTSAAVEGTSWVVESGRPGAQAV